MRYEASGIFILHLFVNLRKKIDLYVIFLSLMLLIRLKSVHWLIHKLKVTK